MASVQVSAAMHQQAVTDINKLALSATRHCLTGCVIGEVSGMVIGTSLGWSDLATVALSVSLAFVFGYALTAIPLLRSDLPLRAAVTAALGSDTVSIAIMEAIDNAAMLLVPGAMDAGLDSLKFWGTLAAGLAVAFPFAFLANKYLITRGLGHARVHQHHASM